jgi:snRNA-activating protein complex subunit 3
MLSCMRSVPPVFELYLLRELTYSVQKQTTSGALFSPPSTTREAVITVAVHNRLTWGHGYLYRASQHILLASQTLGDIFEVIPCTSKDPASRSNDSCVVCVESLAYGDGQSEVDYAEQVVSGNTYDGEPDFL